MLMRLRHMLCAVLPVVALVALIVGPTGIAARAQHCEGNDLARDGGKRLEEAPSDAGLPADPGRMETRTPSEDGDSKPDKPKGSASFVAPKAAKPSEVQTKSLPLSAQTRHIPGRVRHDGRSGISCTQVAVVKALHCPAYRPNGPPAVRC